MDYKEKFDKARMYVLFNHRLLGALMSRMGWRVLDRADGPLAWTNGREICVTTRCLERFTDAEMRFVLMHELMHVMHLHHLRRPPEAKDDREAAMRWNLALDAKVNRRLLEVTSRSHEVTMPDCGVRSLEQFGLPDDELDTMTEEDVYRWLTRCQDEKMQQEGEQGGMGGDVRSGDGDDDGEGDGEGDGGTRDGGDVVAAMPGRGQVTEDVLRDVAAAVLATSRGCDPSDMLGGEIVARLLKPVVPWQVLLAEFMQSTCESTERTWTRRHRRFPDVVLPGMGEDCIELLDVAIDTSGSCIDYVDRFVTELRSLLEQVPCRRVRVWLHTARVYEVLDSEELQVDPPMVFDHMPDHLQIAGTDYAEVIEGIVNEPGDCVVWMTDLEVSATPQVTALPDTLWVVPDLVGHERAAWMHENVLQGHGRVAVMEER